MSFTFGFSRKNLQQTFQKRGDNMKQEGKTPETCSDLSQPPKIARSAPAQIAYMAVGMPRDASRRNFVKSASMSKQNLYEFMGYIWYIW
jgi:hypothetical protein